MKQLTLKFKYMKATLVNYRNEEIDAFVHQVEKNLIFVTTSLNIEVRKGVKKLSQNKLGFNEYSMTRIALDKYLLNLDIKFSVLNQFSKIINERFCDVHYREDYHVYSEIYESIKK